MADTTALGSDPPPSVMASATAALNRAKASAAGLLSSSRPWAELADRSAFAKPADVAEVRKGGVGLGERQAACPSP